MKFGLLFLSTLFHLAAGCSAADQTDSNSNQVSNETLQRISFKAASHQKRKAIAEAVAKSVASNLGVLCEQQNQLLKSQGFFACQNQDCQLESTKTDIPGKTEVNLVAEFGKNQWEIRVEFQFNPARSTTFLMCSAPELMSVVRQAHLEIMLDWRMAE